MADLQGAFNGTLNAAGDRLQVATVGVQSTFTDRSGTIGTGGTAQQVAAANTARKAFVFQNVSDTTMWVNFGATAVADQPSFQVTAGLFLRFESGFIPTGLVSVICATTGKSFTCKES